MPNNAEIAVVLKLVADQFQSQLNKSKGLLGDFGRLLSDPRAQLAAFGATLFATAKATAAASSEILKNAQVAGMQAESYQRVSYAAKIADLDQNQLALGLKALSQYMSETGQTGIPLQEMLLKTADRFAHMADGAAKNTLMVKMFGKAAGPDLLNFLNMGRAGIEGYMREADRLGIVISEKNLKSAAAFEDQLKRLTAVAASFRNEIGLQVIPQLSRLLDLFERFATSDFGKGLAAATARMFSGQSGIIGMLGMPIADYFLPPGTLKEPGKGGPGGPGGMDEATQRAKAAALKGQLAVTETALAGEAALYKAHTDVKLALVKLEASRRTVMEEQAQDQIATLRSGVLVLERNNLQRLAEAVETYYTQRKALGFQNLKEQEDVEQEHAKKAVEIKAAIAKKEAEWNQLGITSTQEAEELKREQYLKTAETLEKLNEQERARRQKDRIENANFWELYQLGMRDYLTNLESTFNIAKDMARETAGAMSGGFKTLFVDAMKGQMTDLKSILAGVRDFAINITGEVAARLATAGLLRSLGGLPGFSILGTPSGAELPAGASGNFGVGVPAAAHGLQFMVAGHGGVDSQLIRFWATPGERVTVETPAQQKGGLPAFERGGQFTVAGQTVVQNNILIRNEAGADVQVRESRGPGGEDVLEILIRKVGDALRGGRFDDPLRTYFGVRRLAGAR